jgi:hypothetical protein
VKQQNKTKPPEAGSINSLLSPFFSDAREVHKITIKSNYLRVIVSVMSQHRKEKRR